MATSLHTPADRLETMIKTQIVNRGINDPALLAAIRAVPREHFFPSKHKRSAYVDKPCALGFGQTISQPYVVALMTERLGVLPHHDVLEIGTGSGYQTSVLAHLTHEVYSIERIKGLLDEAFERVLSLGKRNVHFHWGDGNQGWPVARTFDRIMFTAAPGDVPGDLLMRSLGEGGRAVLPVGEADSQQLVCVERTATGLKESQICPVRFVQLLGGKA
jgi:protein-L-isoaspartate(D-aspartate) O-methyltransferase